MKMSSIREYTSEELEGQLAAKRKELFGLKVKNRTGEPAEQPLLIRELRRDVARIKTVIRERQPAAAGEKSAAGDAVGDS